jgi:hypothetical protein
MSADVAAPPRIDAARRLLAELAWLTPLLRREVRRLRRARLLHEDDLRGLYIPDPLADALLDDLSGGEPDEFHEARPDRDRATPLGRLAHRFGLSPAEADALVVAIAPHVDPRWQTVYGFVQNSVTLRRPSVDLALRLLVPDPAERLACRCWFTPTAPLVQNALIRLVAEPGDPAPPLSSRTIAVDDRIVSHLLGDDTLAPELATWVTLRPARHLDDLVLTPELRTRLNGAAAAFSETSTGSPEVNGSIVLLDGPPGSGRETLAAALTGGRPLLVADASAPPAAAAEGVLLAREALMLGAGVYLTGVDERFDVTGTVQALRRLGVPVVLGGGAQGVPKTEMVRLSVPDGPERRMLWDRALRGRSRLKAAELGRLADLFAIGPGAIERAATEAIHRAAARGEVAGEEDLRRAVRERTGSELSGLAQRLPSGPMWEHLVLPPRTLGEVQLVCAAVEHRGTIRDGWGFGGTLLGRGVTALFHGPSGTGKTLAARVVAKHLGLELYRVDLSTVVSKYIGETERNLAQIFRAARAAHAVVLFDEADALFGRRSAVHDARDRYANIEVAHLLQELEAFDGVALLATNLSGNLDDAFARRLGHAVEFPFPGAELREALWRQALPARAPLAAEVDAAALARLQLAGGHIHSAALSAACRAAAAGRPVGMRDLVPAAAAELRKLHRMPDRSDFGEYYALLAGEP